MVSWIEEFKPFGHGVVLRKERKGKDRKGKERNPRLAPTAARQPCRHCADARMQPKALHTRGDGYKNFNPWIHVAKFLFRTSPTRILTLGPKKTLSYRADLTVMGNSVRSSTRDSTVQISRHLKTPPELISHQRQKSS